jgi:hypothetical protein
VIARRSDVSGIALKVVRMDQYIFAYLLDDNTLINHLPMQKVVLRPNPVFITVSVYSSVSGGSKSVCDDRLIAAG